MVSIECELCHTERLEIVLISQKVVKLVFVIVANRRDVEEPEVVIKGDPEATVVFINETNLLLRTFCPSGRLITPVTLPFFLTPGVANLNQALCLSVIKRDYFCSNQTVCMSINQANRLDCLITECCIRLTCHGCAHRECLLVRV